MAFTDLSNHFRRVRLTCGAGISLSSRISKPAGRSTDLEHLEQIRKELGKK
jgi:hypothetical protein